AIRLESVFHRMTPQDVEAMKEASRRPLVPQPAVTLDVGFDDVYPPDAMIDFPKRPPWTRTQSKQDLESQEQRAFDSWLDGLRMRFASSPSLSLFELNLEVWRQLWRVVEASDLVLLVVDARHPVLHFPPALYEYVDLVPSDIAAAWTAYFAERFPGLHIVSFSCYPKESLLEQQKQQQQAINARNRRIKRYARAVGVIQLVEACRDVQVYKQGVRVDWDGLLARLRANMKVRMADDQRRAAARESQEGFLGRSRKRQGMPSAGTDGGHGTDSDSDLDLDEDEDGADTGVPDLDAALESLELGGGSKSSAVQEGLGGPHKQMITIGLVGHPNVGKSSLINGILGRKVVSTSRTPGHTKHFQTIHLTRELRLCDCPGLVFPSVIPRPLQILSGMYHIAQVQDPYSSVGFLAERIPVADILSLDPPNYTDGNDAGSTGGGNHHPTATATNRQKASARQQFAWSGWTICEAFALQRGFLTTRAARPDVYRAANLLLRMANDGRLLLVYRPTGYSQGRWADSADNVPKHVDVGAAMNELYADQGDADGDESDGHKVEHERVARVVTNSNPFDRLERGGQ
ncbi:hypothetical protein BC831DRAFT_406279, partial [Entophlyctis helioformis]